MSLNNFSKLFGCNIHGSIRVSALALKIINTPEFQRLKNIKQLGLCHLVYPSATHTRFEHSIGVYYLAGQMIDKIRKLYPYKYFDIPELGESFVLTDLIVECIKIAALCHDIGHGPFSHIFDDVLLNNSKSHPNIKHETRSCEIVEILCKRVLFDELNDYHIAFIKSIINPGPNNTGAIYQIVSNYLNGIDVDKFDYLARDSVGLGLKNSFDYHRLINEIKLDENNNIIYPKHCSIDIYEMFHSRYMMHKKVYSHKTVKLLEVMLNDLFLKIDVVFGISESINDMEKFCKLTDNTIFNYIEIIVNPPSFVCINLNDSDNKKVLEAYQIYQSIITRKLYKQIYEIYSDSPYEENFKSFIQFIKTKYPQILTTDFQILRKKIGYVNDNKDPFNHIYFYDKKENNATFTLGHSNYSGLINNNLQETHMHLIYRNNSNYQLILSEAASYNFNSRL